VEAEETVCLDHCNTGTVSAPAVPSSPISTVSVVEASNTVDDSEGLLDTAPCSPRPVTSLSSLQTLDVESHEIDSIGANRPSSPVTDVGEVVDVHPIKPLASSECSTDLSQCSEEISLNSDTLTDDQKRSDKSFRNSRNNSSSSLTEVSDNKRGKTGANTNQSRKRKHEDELPEYEGLMFDKVPNYYTALSIPTRVKAGSTARSSSDLIADFIQNERDLSPERKSCSVYDKLPAYYSSFTNSTRYDDHGYMSPSEFETNLYEDEADDERRFGRSCDENYKLNDLNSADKQPVEENGQNDDSGEENETNTENVSHFIEKYAVLSLVIICGTGL